eukprot:6197641-Pleurochrysis_carterae.AAC.4
MDRVISDARSRVATSSGSLEGESASRSCSKPSNDALVDAGRNTRRSPSSLKYAGVETEPGIWTDGGRRAVGAVFSSLLTSRLGTGSEVVSIL